MCLNVTSATPNSKLQIIEVQQETHSEPLKINSLALSLPSSLQEELINDDFIYVPPESQTQQTFNEEQKTQQQPSKEPAAQQTEQQKQAAEESSPRNTEPEPLINVSHPKQQQQEAQPEFFISSVSYICPPEPEKQDVEISSLRKTEPKLTLSVTSSVIKELINDAYIYEVFDNDPAEKQQQPRQRKYDMPFFSLGISPPASQPTHPSEPPVSQLKILAEAVEDAGVTTALKFAEATSFEPTLPAAEVFKTPEKKIKISKELIEKCYHWMTHVKTTKDSRNEYDTIFVLKHEALYEGLTEYFMSLMPKEQVHAMNFMSGTYGVDYTDKRTNKAYSYLCQFAMERIGGFNNFLDEGVRWGGTLNGGRTGRGSRVYPTEWSTYREEIDDFRYRYGPNLLLHKMNKIRDQVIWESEAIRLPKPSTVLSSLYCKFTSGDLDSK
ncbi:uncharacterized protein DS421_20g687310 [Arachis hypogaea]|nr:uncharacterized protein DS421_20g687310 [Arachis hypogaea]